MRTVTRAHFDALLFDLDGTLLDGQSRLTEGARAQVQRACDLGYLVVIATGRSPSGTREVHGGLGLRTEMVCYNGAWIGAPSGHPWHYAPIPDDLLASVGAAEAQAQFLFRHHGDSKYTPRSPDPRHPRLASWFHNVVVVEPDNGGLPRRDLVRVSLFFEDSHATDAAWRALPDPARERLHREVFPMNLFPGFEDSGLWLCELQQRGRGKAEAFRLLSERYGVPASRVVAVGDQMNDLPMLREAGLAVSMGNGVPPVRAEADLVIGDHREDGLARWLEAELG